MYKWLQTIRLCQTPGLSEGSLHQSDIGIDYAIKAMDAAGDWASTFTVTVQQNKVACENNLAHCDLWM